MLSDALKEMRERVRIGGLPQDTAGLMLTLEAFELEARNPENRIEIATGRPHVALYGKLISSSAFDAMGGNA